MKLYDAFISYSHDKDKPIAAALQSTIQKLGKPWYRRRASRVFRDDTSLAATPHLWPSIEQALDQARFFVLLASPKAAASKWVDKEAAHWLDRNSTATVLIGLTDGELAWDDAVGDFVGGEHLPIPPALRRRFSSEPKWVDLRPYRSGADTGDARFTELAADFAAAIRGMPKEDVLSEEVRQQRRALTLAWTAAGSLLVLSAVAGTQWYEATVQRRAAVQQLDVALTQRARLLATRADDARRAGRVDETLLLLREAHRVAEESPRIGTPADAQVTLARTFNMPNADALVWHDGPVRAAAFSADGRRLVTASDDTTARVWDAATGRLMTTLRGHAGPVVSALFGPDGDFIITASLDDTVRVWKADGGALLLSLTCSSGGLTGASASPDGKQIVAGSRDGTTCLWDLASGRRIALVHAGAVNSAVFSADSSKILTASADKTTRLWDARSGELPPDLRGSC